MKHKKKLLSVIAPVLAVGLVATACAKSKPAATPTSESTSASTSASAPAAAVVTDSKAADLRTSFNSLLGEHLVLAAKAVGAALGGRTAEFSAYGNLLNTNGTDLGAMVGAAFGADAQKAFNGIWSAHNGFFVDYTKGVAAHNKVQMDKAVSDLTTVYLPQFANLIAGATGLPAAAVSDLTKTHVLTTKDIVDKLGAKDYPGAYSAIRMAYAHMQKIGDPVAEAIAGKKPDLFPGDAKNKGVDFRVALNGLLQEHLYLATSATDAALGGRNDEFGAAGDALNKNGTDLGAAVGSIYGPAAQTQFNGIWSAHNGFFVDYTKGVAAKNKAQMDKAVSDLTTTYIPQFSQFLAGATGLPTDAIAGLTKDHVLTTKAVVDDQGKKDAAAAASADRMAAQHMQKIGDPLAKAIVAKMPDKFPG
jgi:hypothetical protein